MKRNWQATIGILIALEEKAYGDSLSLESFPDGNPAEISYNMELLISAGFVNGQMVDESGGHPQNFMALGLTWEGHNLADKMNRSPFF